MSTQLDLQWTSVNSTVAELWQFYRKGLPRIVKATEGYAGILEEESHSKDDMFIITHAKTQKRVAMINAVDPQGTLTVSISMPIDINLKFHIKRKDGRFNYKNAETLQEIDDDRGLTHGMTLRPANRRKTAFKKVDDSDASIQLNELRVINIYDESYFAAFPLPELTSPYNETKILPFHMDIKFKVAECVCSGTEADFRAYVEKILIQMKDFQHSELIHGCKEIMLYDDDTADDDPYEYIKPTDYIRFNSAGILDHIGCSSPNSAPPSPRFQEYNNSVDGTAASGQCVTEHRSVSLDNSPVLSPRLKQHSNSSEVTRRAPPIPGPRLPPKPRKKPSQSTSDVPSHDSCSSVPNKPVPAKRQVKQLVRSQSDSTRSQSDSTPSQSDSTHAAAVAPESPTTTKKFSPLKQLFSSFKGHKAKTVDEVSTDAADSTAAHSSGASDKPKLSVKSKAPAQPPADSDIAKPTCVVAPTPHLCAESGAEAALTDASHQRSGDATKKEKVYATFSEIPTDVSTLSSAEVSACLHRMQMDKHIEEFKKTQIDGALLVSMSREELEELGLNKTEIMKIQLFIKGYRPNRAT